ncbi:hypothetical protein Poli38472_013400 [Pythium oligandrum]|uniref:Uncharacterized protein n=1 Tax=Pythium oligandrum TaxID=41045 RepID=A0A8K1C7P5_PYTOL|nr:hypothetical protein Poli38472_013400 [Pythium oligandrum]|eukprot:TMW57926.1 hypothetical protein Poli38472_013400 [Pythium oligandrum]
MDEAVNQLRAGVPSGNIVVNVDMGDNIGYGYSRTLGHRFNVRAARTVFRQDVQPDGRVLLHEITSYPVPAANRGWGEDLRAADYAMRPRVAGNELTRRHGLYHRDYREEEVDVSA